MFSVFCLACLCFSGYICAMCGGEMCFRGLGRGLRVVLVGGGCGFGVILSGNMWVVWCFWGLKFSFFVFLVSLVYFFRIV